MKLQLLRGWKKFNTNPNDIELLLMGMEEVLGMVRGVSEMFVVQQYAVYQSIFRICCCCT